MNDDPFLTGSRSKNGTLEAIVEQDDRVAHLYLRQAEQSQRSPRRSCWIRNLKPAPATVDAAMRAAKSGSAPMMPRPFCAHPEGLAPLTESGIRFVWAEDGESVAVLEQNEVLAILTWDNDADRSAGFARDCTDETPLALPLAPTDPQIDAIRAAEQCWRDWDTEDPWPVVRDGTAESLSAACAGEQRYFAIGGEQWPPRGLIRTSTKDTVVLLTVGMQLQPQRIAGLRDEDAREHRRIELGLATAWSILERTDGRLESWLAGQTRYPWRWHSWLGHHHTMPCDAFAPIRSGPRFEAMLLRRDVLGAPSIDLKPHRGDPVHVLWLTPITETEQSMAEARGSATLSERLTAAGHGWVHRDRKSVA